MQDAAAALMRLHESGECRTWADVAARVGEPNKGNAHRMAHGRLAVPPRVMAALGLDVAGISDEGARHGVRLRVSIEDARLLAAGTVSPALAARAAAAIARRGQ